MFLHFHRGRKRGKREIVKPRFFVLRRRTLTFGTALLMAVAIFGAVNAPAAVRTSAAVPSRFMRKIVCRLRLNEVSRQ